jgi:hypothetical protein
MSSSVPRRSTVHERHRLIGHARADDVAASRRGVPMTAGDFLHDVRRFAEALPDRSHILNFCADRCRFAAVLCAAIVRGQTTLLPPTTTPNVIRSMRDFAPDAYFVSEDPAAGGPAAGRAAVG